MEWVLPFVSILVVLLLAVPVAVLVGAVLVLGLLSHIRPESSMVARTSFECPFSKRRASVEFLTTPEADRPADVLSCSVFSKPYHVRCKKGCLELAEAGWAPSLSVPRYALLSGGVVLRPVSRSQAAGVTSPSAN